MGLEFRKVPFKKDVRLTPAQLRYLAQLVDRVQAELDELRSALLVFGGKR